MARTPEPTGLQTPDRDEDIFDLLAGLTPASAAAQLRARRPDVVRATQASYSALLRPDDYAHVTPREREMVALRSALLTPSASVANWHRERLREQGLDDAALAAIEHFPDAPGLSARDEAILHFTDRLTQAPGTAEPSHITALKDAGLSPRDIVTIAQLIAFVSYETRVLVGVRILGGEV